MAHVEGREPLGPGSCHRKRQCHGCHGRTRQSCHPRAGCPGQHRPAVRHGVPGTGTLGTGAGPKAQGAALRQRLGSPIAPAQGLQTETTFLHTLPVSAAPTPGRAWAGIASSSWTQDPSWQTAPRATALQRSRHCRSPAPHAFPACPKLCGYTCSSPCLFLPDPACPLPHLGNSPPPRHQLLANPSLLFPQAGGGVLAPSPAASPAPALLLSTASCLDKDDAAGVSRADHLHPAGTETSTAVSSLGSTDPSCKPHMTDPPGRHTGSRHPDPCVEPLLHSATPAPWDGEETMLLSAGKPSRWEIQEGFEETSQPLAEASKIAFVFNWRENSPDRPICRRAWWRARQPQGCRKWVRELQTPWGSCCVS
ncbi:uncharacterized protein LOC121233208 isoform X3 [Aquila chrysaetos chrysaetos]|uniref:uncharacterized protein LOC121233208 isoform X3 n=1 Tax=Aquila chrysaetos chrysaetos TaxID=223781 RepID=UPI001B7D3F69|nr:uncharacterized protein LOC121233208 isoform X3 [Aquila chrysaetos chrysaetos]